MNCKKTPIYQRLSETFKWLRIKVSKINLSCKKNILKWVSAIYKKISEKYNLS